MKILPTLQEENSGMRFRTGQGKPGLNILLGGTLQDDGLSSTFGGAGSIGATARLAGVYKDTRLRQVASGSSGPSFGTDRPGSGYGGRDPFNPGGGFTRPPTRPER